MAQRPEEELPESVILGMFEGLKNTVAPERLMPGELEKANNVDIDDAGQVRRRRGQTLRAAGDFHSLHEHLDELYAVKDGTLGVVYPDYTFSGIVAAGTARLSYAAVGETLYYSSEAESGKIIDKTNYPPDRDWETTPSVPSLTA